MNLASQISQLVRTMSNDVQNTFPTNVMVNRNVTQDGRRICSICQRPGHIARAYCILSVEVGTLADKEISSRHVSCRNVTLPLNTEILARKHAYQSVITDRNHELDLRINKEVHRACRSGTCGHLSAVHRQASLL